MAETADRSEFERKAREIVVDQLRRLPSGRALTKDELLQQHPELAGELLAVLSEHERLVAVLRAPQAAEYDATPDNGGVTVDTPANSEQRLASAQRTMIGKYEVMSRIGRGGQAEVFQAFDPALPGRIVAIKWFFEELSSEDQSAWQRDVMPSTKIDDPGIVRLYDAGVCKGRPYLVFEFVEGIPPKVAVDQSRTPMRRAAEILADVAGIIAGLHQQGFHHADLKPGNVLIDTRGRARILDFGLSSWNRVGAPCVERSSGPVGTPGYMAPEQARGDAGPPDHRTDVFGLGAVGYALLTGRPPYDRKNLGEALDQARRAECPAPRSVEPRVPRTLDRIIRKAMRADPALRYQTAADLERALRWHLLLSSRSTLALGAAALMVGIAVAIFATVQGVWAPASVQPPEVATGPLSSPKSAAGKGEAADKDAGRTSPPEAVPVSLDGSLTVRVWNEEPDSAKQGIAVGDPGAVPVRNGDLVHLRAQLDAPAHIYLLWIGSDGKAQRLHPADIAEVPSLQELDSPEELHRGWPINGTPGLETAVMIATRTPLDKAFWDSLPGEIPSRSQFDPNQVLWVELKPSSTHPVIRGLTRGLGTQSEAIKDPLLEFLERFRPHAELIQAVRFAHVE